MSHGALAVRFRHLQRTLCIWFFQLRNRLWTSQCPWSLHKSRRLRGLDRTDHFDCQKEVKSPEAAFYILEYSRIKIWAPQFLKSLVKRSKSRVMWNYLHNWHWKIPFYWTEEPYSNKKKVVSLFGDSNTFLWVFKNRNDASIHAHNWFSSRGSNTSK